jgi:SH3-like domain-containing protein
MKTVHALRRALFAATLLGFAIAAHAVEYRAIGAAPAVLYDAPTAKGRKVFVAPRGMPVEVVLTYGEWTKVRDAAGDLAWVETRTLAPRRNVVVSVPNARVRTAANEAAALAFTADRGVLLEIAEPMTAGWVRVRHNDGLVGFVHAGEVWGE